MENLTTKILKNNAPAFATEYPKKMKTSKDQKGNACILNIPI
jgi:hypothetical protein